MSILTSFLKLFKYDPIVDKDSTFNITQALNDNWDKIDADKKAQDDAIAALGEAVGNIQIPVTSVNEKTGAVMLSAADVGAETPSEAQSKANAALNAANDYTDGVAGTLSTQMADLAQGLNTHESKSATTSAKGHVELATNAEVTAGTDTTRAVTPAGLKVELDKKLNSSAYTAADVLAKIKTVDGAGSGLDADLLDGKQASYFQTFNKLYGYNDFTDTIIKTQTVTKNIPIGSGKSSAILLVSEIYLGSNYAFKRGGSVFCGTDKTKSYAFGSDGGYVSSRQWCNYLSNYENGKVVNAGVEINLVDAYISGSNLVLVFENNSTTTDRNLNVRVTWEVW